MPSSGFFPNSTTTTTKPEPKCAECKRMVAVLEQMRDLPLNERVSYVYLGLINEALEGK